MRYIKLLKYRVFGITPKDGSLNEYIRRQSNLRLMEREKRLLFKQMMKSANKSG